MVAKMRMSIKASIGSGKKYLFKNGNEFTAITGGWGRYAWSYNAASDTGGAPGGNNNGTSLVVSLDNLYNSAISGVIRTGNMIDLTTVGTIRVHISGTLGSCDTANGGYQQVYLFTRQNATGNWDTGCTALSLVIGHDTGGNVSFDGDYTLNVAPLTGNHYVCIGIRWKKQNAATTLYCNSIERAT